MHGHRIMLKGVQGCTRRLLVLFKKKKKYEVERKIDKVGVA